ncbi:YceI family protein [Autumnicola musiva]|uniref:YceI family protein n=1 Tax=Autumnicola musiva TaxID=3075589 RepID=A0ABU3DAW2_9FLAO|nr:YceI family protein [Zunongwangia sp. F117]MDT0678670.1 YceI family protein [Zunongwangia sp. F117]
MNTLKNFGLGIASLLIMVISVQSSFAQTFSVKTARSNLKIEGTSNIHDWEIEAEDFQGTLSAEFQEGQLTKINNLEFSVVAESLKSGKGAMDKNTYKALNTDKHKKITYSMTKVNNIDCTSNANCIVTTSGYLTIAGIKNPVNITFNAQANDSKVVLSGNETIKMSEYKIDAPTAMFGTITTGDEVKINFQTTFSK